MFLFYFHEFIPFHNCQHSISLRYQMNGNTKQNSIKDQWLFSIVVPSLSKRNNVDARKIQFFFFFLFSSFNTSIQYHDNEDNIDDGCVNQIKFKLHLLQILNHLRIKIETFDHNMSTHWRQQRKKRAKGNLFRYEKFKCNFY